MGGALSTGFVTVIQPGLAALVSIVNEPYTETGAFHCQGNVASLLRRAHHRQGAALVQFAPIAVVRSGVLSIAISHGRDRTGAAEGELNFLVCPSRGGPGRPPLPRSQTRGLRHPHCSDGAIRC